MKSEVTSSIGFVLKFLRQLYCYKAVDFSKEIGISASYLSEIENSRKTPNLDLLERYSSVLKIKVSTMLLLAEKSSSLKENNQETILILLQGLKPD